MTSERKREQSSDDSPSLAMQNAVFPHKEIRRCEWLGLVAQVGQRRTVLRAAELVVHEFW